MCQHDRPTPTPTSPLEAALAECAALIITRQLDGFSLRGEWDGSARLWCRRPDCGWQTTVLDLGTAILDAQDHRDPSRAAAA